MLVWGINQLIVVVYNEECHEYIFCEGFISVLEVLNNSF